MLETDDLIVALINEDQNQFAPALSRLGMSGRFMALPSHEPFLPPDRANTVLQTIQQSLPHSQPIPTSADMAMSAGMREILTNATLLREKLQSKEVPPLHLLAVLVQGSQKGVQTLRDAGIQTKKSSR